MSPARAPSIRLLATLLMCSWASLASGRAALDHTKAIRIGDRLLRPSAAPQRPRATPKPARIATSDTVVVLATQTCIRTAGGDWTTCTNTFSASPTSGRKLVVLLDNGNPDGTQRASGVTVTIGSRQWVGGNEVTLTTPALARTVDLSASNTMDVAVRGNVGVRASYSVVSVPDPTFRMLGVVTFTRGSGAPQIEKRAIVPPGGSGSPFTLLITNGAANGTQRVSSATVALGGVPLVTAGDLNPGVAVLERVVGPQSSDSLELRLAGDAGSFVTVELRTLDTAPPAILVGTPTEAMETASSSVGVSGQILDSTAVTLDLNGTPLAVGAGGTFSTSAAVSMGSNTLTLTAIDAAGNQSVLTRHVIREVSPLSPPAVQGTSLTTITPFRDAYAFLFRSPGGTQFGADTTLFEARRAAVLRGYLMHTEGTPIFNVRVEILDQARAGWTTSRADGAWELMVAGGGPLDLRFTKAGYVPVQRRIDVPWRDVAVADTVIMTRLDTIATSIAFSAAVEVARGSAVHDTSGTRQATLMFKQGTTASMVMPNGTTQALGSIHVRATELTVGPNGRRAMAAELPPTSAYTYFVELSADEADAAGATSVNFSKPVSFYVENFLNLPVGTPLPVGSYERVRGAWVPEANGLTIKIVGRDSSMALVDLNGDGNADTPAALLGIGIDAAERAKLADLYPDNTVLWRVQTTHFSPGDINMGLALIIGAVAPALDYIKKLLEGINCQSQSGGSVIECESRVLGETIPIVGTPYDLVYRSSRAPGFAAARHISIPITGDVAPPSVLTRVHVLVYVAGTTHEFTFSNSPPLGANLRLDFTWDGRDFLGRLVRGSADATVVIEWSYPTVIAIAGGGDLSLPGFALPPRGGPIANQYTRGAEGGYRMTQHVALGAFDETQLAIGGWSLSPHHVYDTNGNGTLYRGDGGRVGGDRLSPQISIAYNDVASSRPGITDVAIGPDGSVYFGRSGAIWRLYPNGLSVQIFQDPASKISGEFHMAVVDSDSILVAATTQRYVYVLKNGALRVLFGDGAQSNTVEGAVGTATSVWGPHGIVAAPDGSIYVSDFDQQVIWRLAMDGRVYRFAGIRQMAGYSASDTLATSAKINNPKNMALGPDGSLYFADASNYVVRRIRPDGRITTVAGKNAFTTSYSGDGGLATNADLRDPSDVALGPDGSLYIASFGLPTDGRLRRVSPDGFISTVAGAGVGFSGPAAASAYGTPYRIAVDQEGRIWSAFGAKEILLISPIMPGFTAGEFLMPSQDGSEVYDFDNSGRHLRTLDGLTGAVRQRFRYNSAGQLDSIFDPANLATKIERDGAGKPTAIVGPFGHRTTLQTDANGFLARVTDPRGAYVQLTPDGQGILRRFEDQNRHGTDLTYDADGLLQVDADAAGGSQTLSGGVVLDSMVHVTRTTGENRTTTYDVTDRRIGDLVRSVTDPANHVTTSTETRAGLTVTNTAEGAQRTTVLSREARLGMAAPILSSLSVSTGGKVLTMSGFRAYDAVPTTFGYGRRVDSVVVNGNTWKSAFDRPSKRLTEISPEGRQTVTVVDSVGRPLRVRVDGLDSLVVGYDSQGRLTSLTQGSRQWAYAYEDSGRLETITDPMTRQTTLRYDPADRVIRQELPGSIAVGLDYDDGGNLTVVTPAGKPTHTFTHTPVDLVASYAPPSLGAGTWSSGYDYDRDRALRHLTRPDGEVVTLDYDNAGRLQQVSHSHDRVVVGYNSTSGLLSSATSDSGASLTYTHAGALPTSEQWSYPGGVQATVSVDYNDDLRVTRQTVIGDSVGFSYDRDGLLVRAGPEKLVRDANNGLLRQTEVGVLITEYAYNGAGELIATRTKTTGNQVLYLEGLTRDPLGRVTIRRDSTWTGSAFDIRTEEYGYDAVGRLGTVTRNGTPIATYGYDANGNRTSFTGATSADTATADYDAQDRLLRYRDTTFTYTANGELATRRITADTTYYQYDALGALRRVKPPGASSIAYLMDAQGRRVGRGDPASPSRLWVYQNGLNVVAELDGSGALTKRFVYGGRGHVPDLMKQGSATYRLVTDHLGSMIALVDVSSGAITQRRTYDVWGGVEKDTAPGSQPFGFAGGFEDLETGLARFGARDYSPGTGRWTSKDPAAHRGGANLYTYGANAPASNVDPSGLITSDDLAFRAEEQYANLPSPSVNAVLDKSLAEPIAAFADGVIPFSDPFEEAGVYVPSRDNGLCWSRAIGVNTRNTELALVSMRAIATSRWFAQSRWFGTNSKFFNQINGLFNKNSVMRIGWGGQEGVPNTFFRIVIGSKEWLLPWLRHLDLR